MGEQMKLADLTEEQKKAVAEARAANGRIRAFATDDGDLVLVRKAAPAERTRYMTEAAKRKEDPNIADANKAIALSAIVYPEELAEKSAILKRFPFLIDDIALAAVELAGGSEIDLGNV